MMAIRSIQRFPEGGILAAFVATEPTLGQTFKGGKTTCRSAHSKWFSAPIEVAPEQVLVFQKRGKSSASDTPVAKFDRVSWDEEVASRQTADTERQVKQGVVFAVTNGATLAKMNFGMGLAAEKVDESVSGETLQKVTGPVRDKLSLASLIAARGLAALSLKRGIGKSDRPLRAVKQVSRDITLRLALEEFGRFDMAMDRFRCGGRVIRLTAALALLASRSGRSQLAGLVMRALRDLDPLTPGSHPEAATQVFLSLVSAGSEAAIWSAFFKKEGSETSPFAQTEQGCFSSGDLPGHGYVGADRGKWLAARAGSRTRLPLANSGGEVSGMRSISGPAEATYRGRTKEIVMANNEVGWFGRKAGSRFDWRPEIPEMRSVRSEHSELADPEDHLTWDSGLATRKIVRLSPPKIPSTVWDGPEVLRQRGLTRTGGKVSGGAMSNVVLNRGHWEADSFVSQHVRSTATARFGRWCIPGDDKLLLRASDSSAKGQTRVVFFTSTTFMSQGSRDLPSTIMTNRG